MEEILFGSPATLPQGPGLAEHAASSILLTSEPAQPTSAPTPSRFSTQTNLNPGIPAANYYTLLYYI